MFTILFFLGSSLFVLSYAVRSIVWLRTLSIIAASLAIPYFFFQTPSDWSAIFWQSTYIIVNFVNLVDLYLKRRPIQLNPDEKLLKESVFKDLKDRELRKIVQIGTRHEVVKDKQILHFKDEVSKLRLIQAGTATVSIHNQPITTLRQGDFIGEMSFLSGSSASADVKANDSLTLLEWDIKELKSFLQKSAIQSMFDGILSKNVVQKLSSQSSERATAS